ncbi:MAG: extracellular solute-binding protein [Phycisphaerae bacterium]|nr:extracellular solute-binding protein [Phycisphaerae bacterium]
MYASRWTTIAMAVLLAAMTAWMPGCRGKDRAADPQTAEADRQVRQRWGVALEDLPTVTLVLISAHNENILDEYERAFRLYHAVQFGQNVFIDRRSVGGGGSTIQRYLRNVYAEADTSRIDVLWGGGDLVFHAMVRPTERHPTGLLEPLVLAEDVVANIPPELNGQRLIDPDHRWVGSAVSGFGFLVNAEMLRRCGITAPRLWQDLGEARFTDLIELADPAQSGSVTATYMTIVKSAPAWPEGWARLLAVLSNAKRIADAAGAAANAPILGDAPIATTIDFYGLMRVAEAPDELVYVSPQGQTSFGADPIGILKNPPHPVLAQRFVDFVMSARGQALWALPVGAADGPVRTALGRQPIRRDVYQRYAGKLLPSVVNPYQAGAAMAVGGEMERVNFGVLQRLVVAAAVDNIDDLRRARATLNRLAIDPSRQEDYRRALEDFCALPADVDTLEKMNSSELTPKDARSFDQINVAWRDYFRTKYERIAAAW